MTKTKKPAARKPAAKKTAARVGNAAEFNFLLRSPVPLWKRLLTTLKKYNAAQASKKLPALTLAAAVRNGVALVCSALERDIRGAKP